MENADVLDLPDRFNAAFARKGWIATASLSLEVMRQALRLHEGGDEDGAEAILTEWISPEVISTLAIGRSKRHSKFGGRWHQLREAAALTEEERFWSAIPLIILATDGYASEILGTSPFEKTADLTLFDSMVGHPTALPALIRQFTKGAYKTTEASTEVPSRHGILHGRALGYANPASCAKCWFLLIALIDWAFDKEAEDTRRLKDETRKKLDWKSLAAGIRENHENQQAIELFETRQWQIPFAAELDEDDPPYALVEFLDAWRDRKYGIMARRAVNLTSQKESVLAGRLRDDGEVVQLLDYEIVEFEQTTVARADAVVRMNGLSLSRPVVADVAVLVFRNTSDGRLAMPRDQGRWQVQQGCMFKLMHSASAADDAM